MTHLPVYFLHFSHIHSHFYILNHSHSNFSQFIYSPTLTHFYSPLFFLSSQQNQRRELVREIVTTEHEYIHDLEALIQVVKCSPEQQREGSLVDVDALMGNIYQVRG